MASDLASIITRLGEKSRFITERYKVVLQERDEAREEIDRLRQEIKDCERRIEVMRTELEYLKVSSVLAPSAESVNATRALLKELISEIELCLKELND